MEQQDNQETPEAALERISRNLSALLFGRSLAANELPETVQLPDRR